MTNMPDNFYDRFNPTKNYEKLLYRDGYTLQGAELNEAQSAALSRLKGVADALFKDGDIIRDAQIIVDATTGAVRAAAGAIYLCGAVRGVPAAEFVIPVTGTVAVGVRLTETVISELDDPALYNPAIGSRGEGEPGAWRLQVNAVWGHDGDGGTGEFYPVYTVDDGELRAKEAPPTLDSFTQGIARYDRDSTAGGSYVVSGLTVLNAGDTEGSQVYTVAEGRARVNGYGVDLATSRRLTYPAVPDLRAIDTEVHIADASSTQSGGQRLPVAHPPLWQVDAVRLTTRKTATLTHGAYAGAQDSLPDTAVVSIVECRQGATVYAQGADYKKTGDKVDWSPSGAEPATGSTYSVTYDCVVAVTPKRFDADGFSVEGAVAGSNILISYQQALPRLDRLCLTQEGQFQWLQGVAAEAQAIAPVVPGHVLPLATIFQTWRAGDEVIGGRRVVNDGVRVVPFAEIDAINRRIDSVVREVARNRLETDISTREAGARAGVFVDPLLDDTMRDQGLEQTAAIVGGELLLPVAAAISSLSKDVAAPTAMPWVPKVLLAQPLRTGSMKVNPYMAFDPLPARVSLAPAVDRWTESQTQWTSSITERFDTGHIVDGVSWIGEQSTASRTEHLGSSTRPLEHLRQIDVTYRVEGFGAGEQLASLTFDGLALTASGAANTSGVLTGSFKVPANIPAGSKTVVFAGKGGSRGSAVFTGQGQLTVATLRQVNTISTVWYDPLAQTVVLDRNLQLGGVDLWFTAAGGEARMQIREVDNGVPTRSVLAEAFIARSAMVLDGGHTRVLLASPLSLVANTEYAVVVLADDAETALAVAELGKFDATVQRWVTSQPYQVGVLLSSSNASTWTAHQDRDLTFRLLEASFSQTADNRNLGAATVSGATDLLLLSLAETPSAATRVEYDLTLPGGVKLTAAEGQPVRLPTPISGQVQVAARLQGTANASPVLWPGSQLVSGAVGQSAEYATRSIVASGATKAVLIYDAVVPSGASVTARLKKDDGAWAALTADGTTPQGNGVVEFRWKTTLANVQAIKAKLTLTGTSAARPRVRNVRLLAVM